jgi:hypothetical protein
MGVLDPGLGRVRGVGHQYTFFVQIQIHIQIQILNLNVRPWFSHSFYHCRCIFCVEGTWSNNSSPGGGVNIKDPKPLCIMECEWRGEG